MGKTTCKRINRLQGRWWKCCRFHIRVQIIEANYKLLPKGYQPIDSLEVKWFYEVENESNHLECPASINGRLKQKIEDICVQTWKALGIRDLCRIDLRCDKQETLFILEVNSPPGLTPPEVSKASYFPLAARVAGIDHQELLRKIILVTRKRYGI